MKSLPAKGQQGPKMGRRMSGVFKEEQGGHMAGAEQTRKGHI